jgi:hypothetical protein
LKHNNSGNIYIAFIYNSVGYVSVKDIREKLTPVIVSADAQKTADVFVTER